MQTAARYQAVFEILSEVFKDKTPADVIMSNYMKSRKYIGSKDRRFILDTSWEIIRSRMRLSFEAKSTDVRKILLVYLKDQDFDIITGGEYGLSPLTQDEKKWLKSLSENEEVYPPYVELECPAWLFEKVGDPALVRALNAPASVDIRANFISKLELKNRLKGEGLFFASAPYSPHGLRSHERININNCIAYKEGLFDLQDESSQVAAVLISPKPNEKIVDYCAGAGGKSLAMGAELQNDGLIFCHDVNFNRMDAIKARAERLGIKNLKLIKEVTDFDFDCFVVDAPCSGSGTFRRAPDAKFRLTPERLDELSKIQAEILEFAYQHTKKGGRIVYMTCSVLLQENEEIVENFVSKHTDISFADHNALWQQKIDAPYPFNTKKYLQFSPLLTNTDGFFFCEMVKK